MHKSHKEIVIYGAGAIGRGFIPWIFSPDTYKLVYVERNAELRNALRLAKKFTTLKTVKSEYQKMVVPVEHCFAPGEEGEALARADAVITAIGPRNIDGLARRLYGSRMPIICCENDPNSAEIIRVETGNQNTVFAVPDVITSNTASATILKQDPLGIITEDGQCFIGERARQLGGNAIYVSQEALNKQWMAKLYLHNTAHCIAAYFGSLLGVRYIHEAMQSPRARSVVRGAMKEMQGALLKTSTIDKNFIDFYAAKELRRFRNTLLPDPISRVARDPLRKLRSGERLLGAADLCLRAEIHPTHLMRGIMAAFFYENSSDADSATLHSLIQKLPPNEFLQTAIGLQPNEPMYQLLVNYWGENLFFLKQCKAQLESSDELI